MVINNNNNNSRIPSRVITKDEVNRILVEISKYLYLSSFNITITNKINQNGKFIINYKVSGSKNNQNIKIDDNFII
ncbi:MAG: hypothetical protein AB7E37_04035 [Candidatus Altimarinota bacterium]